MADFITPPAPVDPVPPAPAPEVHYVYPGDVRSEFSV